MINFIRRYLLIFIGLIIDFFLSGMLPSTFGYQGFVITPYFGFIGLMLVNRRFDLSKRLIVSFLFALIIEIQLFNSSYIPMLSIMILAVIGYLINDIFSNTFLEKGIFLFFAISLLELTSYTLAHIFSKIDIGFVAFLTYQFILTMIFNLIAIIGMLLIESFLVDQSIQRQRIKKRRENISLLE